MLFNKMQLLENILPRSLLPLTVFASVFVLHYASTGLALEKECAVKSGDTRQACCPPSWETHYIKTQNYFMGYSYGLSLAFAGVALRRYREQRMCSARNLALGSVTLSGFLAVAGCFLLGCCGSPMLGVYLSLFGASFMPLAKPLIAGLTTIMIGASYWWLRHRSRTRPPDSSICSTTGTCGCDESSVSHSSR